MVLLHNLSMVTTTTGFENLIIDNLEGINLLSSINVNDTLKLTNGTLIVGETTLGINGAITYSRQVILT